ncbi:MAG: DUF1501 domain-containing protein [Betaproteobacteria bacterium]|nr:DUF1501 domain-containing protein [Betaproteobacteria bacterium]
MKTNRRRFLQAASGLLLPAMVPVTARNAHAQLENIVQLAAGDDYRALVCIFMFGGNDGNNLIVPRDQADYTRYSIPRGGLALGRDQLLSVKPTNVQGREFGFHPAMAGIQSLFNQGKAAVIANVGTLAAPITKAQYQSGSVPRPANLFSHSDQQFLWNTAMPDNSVRSGWGGRIGDRVAALNQSGSLTTCMSVAGNSTFLSGDTIRSFPVSPSGQFGLDFYDTGTQTKPLTDGIQKLLAQSSVRPSVMDGVWLDILSGAITNQKQISTALNAAAPFNTVFPNSGLGQAMRMIVRLIAARNAFGAKRQVFFAGIGGFDTHGDDQLDRQNELLGDVSASMAAFYNATVEINMAENVTAFTASDFGRNFPTNGKGSDHAWGSHHLVAGGAVKGNAMYGTFPTLVVDGPDDVGKGTWIPSVSVDQYAATMATWFGVGSADLNAVFPNLSRFPTGNLGFMV